MMFLTKTLHRICILSILPIAATTAISSQTELAALSDSRIPITSNDGIVNPFVDLDDSNQDQEIEHTFKIPEYKPKKRKHNPAIDSECQSSETPQKKQKNIQDSFLGENTVGYLGEFKHELPNAFIFAQKFFDYESYYNKTLAFNDSAFIEEFCNQYRFKMVDSDIYLRLDERIQNDFEQLELYVKRVVSEYVEIFYSEKKFRMHEFINKALDPARTKGFYYLLIYSFYETGLIGVPRCITAVEKIFINIITHTRLMAYIHNDEVRDRMQSKKLLPSRPNRSKMNRSEQSKYSTLNFSYADFTKALTGGRFNKHDLFCKNADLMRKEINDNMQLIINEEFSENPEYRRLCEDYNSKSLELNINILFERFPFKIGKHAEDNYLYQNVDYDSIIYLNGYPKNILSYLMDTETKNQIKSFADIRLKSVFILIFISKICLCNVTDLCTLPEYLILIGSLQEAYIKHKANLGTTADFQPLTSYFFSLHYLDKDQKKVGNRRKRAKNLILNVFPEYKEIFPNFNYEIYNLERS